MVLTRFVTITLVAVLAACAIRPDVGTGPAASAMPATERILIATTRARSDNPAELYSGERGSRLDHAAVTVSIPPLHRPGELERPRYGEASEAKHFTIRDRAYLDGEQDFVGVINEAIAANTSGDVLLFVHGYNNAFSESVLRFAQFAHDSGFDGTFVLFTWASRGSAVEYLYDRESATIARDGLERTLRQLASSRAGNIHIMAHSMGNWVAMESLRQLQIAGDPTLGSKIGEVVLASPDIDVDVFKSQMRRLGRPSKPYNLLVSKNDRALNLSQKLSGNRPRLGNYANDAEIADLGIIVYDLTKVGSGDPMHHGKFAQASGIVRLLGSRLNDNNQLASDEVRFSDRLQALTRNIGEVVASTGDVIIHTPQTVLTRPDEIIVAPVEVLAGTIRASDCGDCDVPAETSRR